MRAASSFGRLGGGLGIVGVGIALSLTASADSGMPNAGSGSPGAQPTAVSADTNLPPPPAMGSNVDASQVRPEDMPTAIRMRRLEQKTQALKERAWQMKARIQMLKEQMLGGGVGAQSVITHTSEMGVSFRLVKIVYSLDGTEVFARTDDSGENLYKTKTFDVFAGPISPGNHTISAVATYKGHGIGPFEYLSKYTFTAKGNAEFVAGEGKIAKVDCKGYEKGNASVPLENRAAIDCTVTQVVPDKGGAAPTQTNPGTTPLPASTTGAATGSAAPEPAK
jgi:hypothetical protein